jgi:hypothetical protein
MKQKIKVMIEQFCGSPLRLVTMVGATHMVTSDERLTFGFKFKMCKKANYCELQYDYGKDLYNMSFSKLTPKGHKQVKEFKGIFCDQLTDLFEDFTDLYLSL